MMTYRTETKTCTDNNWIRLPLLMGDSLPPWGREISISKDLGLESSKLLDIVFFWDSDPMTPKNIHGILPKINIPGERFSLEASMAHFLIGIGSEDTDDGSGLMLRIGWELFWWEESKCFLIPIGSDELSRKASEFLWEPSRLLEYPSGPGEVGSSVSWKEGRAPPVLKEIFLLEASAVDFGTGCGLLKKAFT